MRIAIPTLAVLAALASGALAGDWSNAGGNPARNGVSDEVGPTAADVLWSGSRPSIIAWQPLIEGDRVFLVRQTGFVPSGVPNEAPVVCQDLETGAELWAAHLPYNAGDWTTWVGGVRDGRVFASRAGNGGSVAAKLHALDAATGQTLWTSTEAVRAGAYDGLSFAPDGDPIVAWHTEVKRIDAVTGQTVWSRPRTASVSGNCGAAVFGDAVYLVDVAPGGQIVRRLDLATGTPQYQSLPMTGTTIQNTPMVGPDGTVYVSRTQNNPLVDFFYAFADTGAAFTLKWSTPAGWSTSSEFATTADGASVYLLGPGNVIEKRAASNGALQATSMSLGSGPITPRLAVDFEGKVYASNGQFPTGAVFCFLPDLSLLFSVAVPNVNIGAPALGHDGTWIVAGVGTNVTAYRSQSPWTDLGQSLAGTDPAPRLEGKGSLTPSLPVTLRIEHGPPQGVAFLVLGGARADLPFAGGTLVPSPQIVFPPLPLGNDGELQLAAPWPAGVPGGFSVYFQAWIPGAGGPEGFVATNALEMLTP